MGNNPRLIFRPDELAGKLVMSFTGPALPNAHLINTDYPHTILDQVSALHSPTGVIEVELPGEPNVRNVPTAISRLEIAA